MRDPASDGELGDDGVIEFAGDHEDPLRPPLPPPEPGNSANNSVAAGCIHSQLTFAWL